jgi:hypothetical protein
MLCVFCNCIFFHVLLPPLQFQIPSPSFITPSRTYS